jgi:hypothetical protein
LKSFPKEGYVRIQRRMLYGGKDEDVRSFKAVEFDKDGNETVIGSHKNRSGPSAAAKKAATQLFRNMPKGSKTDSVTVNIREALEKKIYTYKVTKVYYDKPVVVTLPNGDKITHEYTTNIKSLKPFGVSPAKKTRGGYGALFLNEE